MKPANDLQTVAAEVRELAGIAVYGQVRLSELSNQILRAEEQLISVSSLNKLSKCYESLEQYHSALQASFKAITDWKAKVEQDALYICNAAHHQLEDNEEIDLTTLEFEATELLRMFTKQLGVLQQRQEKTGCCNNRLNKCITIAVNAIPKPIENCCIVAEILVT
jgi:hypothetical protein